MGRNTSTVKEYRGDRTSITFWLDPETKTALIKRAKAEHRDVTGQILHLIEQDLATVQDQPSPLSPSLTQSAGVNGGD